MAKKKTIRTIPQARTPMREQEPQTRGRNCREVACGYRVEDAFGSLAYLPDHAPAAGVSAELMRMLDGVDVLVHDAQFLESERRLAEDYGHCTVQDAVSLAVHCEVGTLVLFHHSPARTDTALDDIARWAPELADDLRVEVAREGSVLDVRGQEPARR